MTYIFTAINSSFFERKEKPTIPDTTSIAVAAQTPNIPEKHGHKDFVKDFFGHYIRPAYNSQPEITIHQDGRVTMNERALTGMDPEQLYKLKNGIPQYDLDMPEASDVWEQDIYLDTIIDRIEFIQPIAEEGKVNIFLDRTGLGEDEKLFFQNIEHRPESIEEFCNMLRARGLVLLTEREEPNSEEWPILVNPSKITGICQLDQGDHCFEFATNNDVVLGIKETAPQLRKTIGEDVYNDLAQWIDWDNNRTIPVLKREAVAKTALGHNPEILQLEQAI